MSEPQPQPQSDPVLKLFGATLMTVGVLMALLCGARTAAAFIFVFSSVVGAIASSLQGRPSYPVGELVVIFLVSGVLPTSVGVAMYLWGRKLYNPAATPYFRRHPKS